MIRLCLLFALVTLGLPVTRAAFLTPTAIVFASNGEATADALIDDSQLSSPAAGDSTHDASASQWTTQGSTKADVVLDLGKTVDLVKVYLWNFQGDRSQGMKDVEIQVSPDSDYSTAHFTAVARISLKEGGDRSQAFDLVATDARLVRVKGLSNWGHGYAVGLGAVRFDTGDITGSVPTVSLVTPVQGDVVGLGVDLQIVASVADKDNDIAKVEFFDGTKLLGSVTKAPYSTVVAGGLKFGEHEIRAVATDKTGKVGWSTANIEVRESVGGKIIQIDDTADIGDGVNQIKYSDGWNLAPGNANDPRFKQNDHYSFTKGSWFEVKFVGTKIDIYATVASHHGLGTAKIDDGAAVDINFQADQRGEQKFIWSSPTLPNREHVLRVTVKGAAVVTADRFDVHVPADRIIQLDDQADIGDAVNQIKYSDGWNLAPGNANDPRFKQNDHYSFTKGSWFEVRFVGTKIDLYATVASHHGLGTATIDGGAAVDINYQADQRGEQKFIWSSPELPYREHVLRVTVKGSAVVTADRFDVHVPAVRILQLDDQADIGDAPNQIKYSDGWNLAPGNANDPRFKQNDHYSFTKGSWFEVTFIGVKIEVYATVASHHGLGVGTLDGGNAFDINYQADQRGEQKFVYSSPELPNRQHVLRVTVKGSAVVTADRFDISVSDEVAADIASVLKVVPGQKTFEIALKDFGASVVKAASLKLFIDGVKVNPNVVKAGDITTLTYAPAIAFVPGSDHRYELSGADTKGNPITSQAAFTIPIPPFPLTGLGEPRGSAGKWGFRQVWNAGLVNGLAGAVDAATQVSRAGFTGKTQDTSVPYLNHANSSAPGAGGLIPNDDPIPAENSGLSANDYVVIAHAYVKIPTAGDWTIGVHSDEGFGLRFIGAPFASVSGAGVLDASYPEYLSNPNNTADSTTRGVLSNLAAGNYEIEFINWQRLGNSYFEVYAAKGDYVDDADTTDWALVGGSGGLELITGAPVYELQSATTVSGPYSKTSATLAPAAKSMTAPVPSVNTFYRISGAPAVVISNIVVEGNNVVIKFQ